MKRIMLIGILGLFAIGAVGARTVTDEQKVAIDQLLSERNLNEFGDPAGTVYAGGTPLFNEATGTTTDRYQYIVSRHPALYREVLNPAGSQIPQPEPSPAASMAPAGPVLPDAPDTPTAPRLPAAPIAP